MLATFTSLLPVLVGLAAGVILRRLRAAGQADGEFVFRVVFYVCLPALMFATLATVQVTEDLLVFLGAPVAMVAAGYLAGRVVARRSGLSPTQVPVLMTGAMIVNAGFALPFIQALYGAPGVARLAIFDGVNAVLTFSWIYSIAARGNPAHRGGALLLGRMLRNPPLYGILAGLAVNLSGLPAPPVLLDVAAPFAAAVPVLIPLGIGILFAPSSDVLGPAGVVVATRLVSALSVVLAMAYVLDLGGMDRTILLLLSVGPIGFVTVTFAALENLDVRLATAALSVSLAVGLVLSFAVALLLG